MANMTAAQMVSLKAAVKAEMQRRNGVGPVSAYGNASWDFTLTPSAGQPMLNDQGHKVIAPILAVKDVSGLADIAAGTPVAAAFDFTGLNTLITNLAAESRYGDSTCRSSCTGLCEGSCTGACSGCSSCYGTCTGSCSGCSGTCTGCTGCGAGCATGCTGCGDQCSSNCVYDDLLA